MKQLSKMSSNHTLNDCLAIGWINLTYYKKSFLGNSSPILCHLKGQIKFGTLTALMGPSGAGKTTLLRCINGVNRDRVSRQTEIYVNKLQPIYPCFIVQDVKQHLLMSLTVKESLKYAILLKNRDKPNKKSMSAANRGRRESLYDDNDNNSYINKLMIDLMLTDCAHNCVKRCSGGEHKRLVIAMELTEHIKPNLICIDEPTSGLDSNTAEQTMLCLRNIAHKHCLAIVTSIHQPNSDVLMMFDKLYVLSKSGRCVFFGAPYQLTDHLFECQIDCFDYQTPIEVLLKVCSKNNKILEDESVGIDLGLNDEVVKLITKTYESMRTIRTECVSNGTLNTLGFETNICMHPIDMWHLFRRNALYSWIREWKLIASQFAFLICFVIILVNIYRNDIGTDASCLTIANHSHVNTNHTFLDDEEHEEPLPQQNLKFLFFVCILILFIQLNATVFTFASEIKIFLNEHRNRWYSSGSYYWSKTVIEMPSLVITACVYCWIGYYFTSQPDMLRWYEMSYRFSLFTTTIILGLLCTQGLAILVGILCSNNYRLAAVMAISIFLFDVLFCGFFVPINHLNHFNTVISYASFVKKCFQCLLIIIYGRNRCNPTVSSILITYAINESDLWTNLLRLLIQFILYRLLALILLMIKANPHWIKLLKSKRQKTTITPNIALIRNFDQNFSFNIKL